MKVSGFTFIRNGVKYDYPIVEAIKSILPICDEVVVAVGNSEDNTLELIENIDPKIRIIETQWDDSLREGGRVLAVETDKAFQAIGDDSDWCFYIQGDEVIHEQYLNTVRQAMEQYKNDSSVDGLLFKYRHFYGSYDYIGVSSRWYRREIRVVKNNKKIYSYKDAQGFRKDDNQKLSVKLIDAYIHHYGWVKEPDLIQQKRVDFNKLWHDDQWIEKNILQAADFDYSQIDALEKYTGTHPQVMIDRIERKNWNFDFDLSRNNFSPREKLKRFIEKLTGYRLGEYKNYKMQ